MRSVIKNRQIVEDHWQAVADDAALPDGPVIVSLARWQRERTATAHSAGCHRPSSRTPTAPNERRGGWIGRRSRRTATG